MPLAATRPFLDRPHWCDAIGKNAGYLLPRKYPRLLGVDSGHNAKGTAVKRGPTISVGLGAMTAIALAIAGCSSGGYGSAGAAFGPARVGVAPSSTVLGGVPAAAARTLTERALIGWQLDGAQVFGPVHAPVYGQGPFDLKAGRGSEVIDLPEVGRQEPGTEHAVFLPTRVFLQPRGSGVTVLPRGKQWLSASLLGAESVNTNFPSFVAQVEGVNPLLLLAELEWGSIAITRLGPGRQIVDHAPAERYRVTVDLQKALAGVGGPLAGVLSQAVQEQLTLGGGAQRFTMVVWVDSRQRVVQVRATPPGTGEGTELLAVSYFGANVRVNAPPGGRVLDITSLTPSGERENNGGGDSDGG